RRDSLAATGAPPLGRPARAVGVSRLQSVGAWLRLPTRRWQLASPAPPRARSPRHREAASRRDRADGALLPVLGARSGAAEDRRCLVVGTGPPLSESRPDAGAAAALSVALLLRWHQRLARCSGGRRSAGAGRGADPHRSREA